MVLKEMVLLLLLLRHRFSQSVRQAGRQDSRPTVACQCASELSRFHSWLRVRLLQFVIRHINQVNEFLAV